MQNILALVVVILSFVALQAHAEVTLQQKETIAPGVIPAKPYNVLKDIKVASPGGETGKLAGLTAEHNKLRSAVNKGLPNLTWDPTIAKFAAQRATDLAKNCTLKHTKSQYGENLAGGNSGYNTAKAIVGNWAAEKAQFDHATKKCKTGNPMDCGHYTQIIWKNTTKLGCGYAACTSQPWGPESAVWVCNYSPPGNYTGQTPY